MRTTPFLGALVLSVLGTASLARADYFGCYTGCTVALATDADCKNGVTLDYDFSTVDRGSSVTVMSFHGGSIELNTTEIARTLADQNAWNRYNFAGHGRSSCLGTLSNYDKLHITATHFNEPTLLNLVGRYPKAVSIHGFNRPAYPPGTLCVGGRNTAQVQAFINSINANKSRFTLYSLNAVNATTAASGTTCSEWPGTATANPVNRNADGAGGLQLEMNYDLRSDLVKTGSSYDALRSVVYGAVRDAMGGGSSTIECNAFSIDAGQINEVTQGTDTACTGVTPAFHVADETAAAGYYYAWIGAATGTVSFPISDGSATGLDVSMRVYGNTAGGAATVYALKTDGVSWGVLGTINTSNVPDWTFKDVTFAVAPLADYKPASGSFSLKVRIVTSSGMSEFDVDRIYVRTKSSAYPVHTNIKSTWFYVGEPASPDNGGIHNDDSVWDDRWREHYGGIDSPTSRSGYWPSGFTPLENPFYVALPYSDFLSNGTRRSNAMTVVYWANEKPSWGPQESMCKNRWVKIMKGTLVAYAQWEDGGPGYLDDAAYVFGSAAPKNTSTGIDVSPAVRDYLRLADTDVVSWQFVDVADVPPGPWRDIITTRQICWGCTN